MIIVWQLCWSYVVGHLLAGEERFRVAMNKNKDVTLELFSFSKPANCLVKLAMPMIRPLQGRFFDDSAKAFVELMADETGGILSAAVTIVCRIDFAVQQTDLRASKMF
jgi:hypothetical protein